jgi:hypothetical protein
MVDDAGGPDETVQEEDSIVMPGLKVSPVIHAAEAL